jgi:hypothetical protein
MLDATPVIDLLVGVSQLALRPDETKPRHRHMGVDGSAPTCGLSGFL